MEENKNEEQESNVSFKTVRDANSYKTVYEVEDKPKMKSGFGRSVVLPFCMGVVGCTVVLGTCFGIPGIKEKIIGETGQSGKTTVSNDIRK